MIGEQPELTALEGGNLPVSVLEVLNGSMKGRNLTFQCQEKKERKTRSDTENRSSGEHRLAEAGVAQSNLPEQSDRSKKDKKIASRQLLFVPSSISSNLLLFISTVSRQGRTKPP